VVSDSTRNFVGRYPRIVAGSCLFVGGVLAAVFVPRSLQRLVIGTMIVAFGLVYVWTITTLPPRPLAVPGKTLTIRDQLKRNRTLYMRTFVPVALAWVVAVTLFHAPLPKWQEQGLCVGGVLVVAVVGFLLVKNGLKCPRCGSTFGKERIAKLGRWTMDTRGPEELWDACPHCGVSFDEPWPDKYVN
jgi:hypothetical protein